LIKEMELFSSKCGTLGQNWRYTSHHFRKNFLGRF
jgi:hypothetical protein